MGARKMVAMILALVLVNPVPLTDTQTEEIHKVEKRLLAPCCYTQSIAEHGSDIAVEMRGEVAEMVADEKSEEEIVNHYRIIYGDRILIVPDGLTGRILFSLPVVTFVLACLVLFRCFQKMLGSRKNRYATNLEQSPHVVDEALRRKIEREIGEPF